MGKTKSQWRQVQRQGQTVLQKNMDRRISAAPGTKIQREIAHPENILLHYSCIPQPYGCKYYPNAFKL